MVTKGEMRGALNPEFDMNIHTLLYTGFPDGSVVGNLPANAGDTGLIPGSGRSLGEGNGNPVQYSEWHKSMTYP